MENILYSWEFSDEKNRWAFWYIIAISVVIWLVFWWVFTWQYWLSIIAILWAWVMFFIENNTSKEIKVEITSLWIKIWENFYDFWKIENYSFIYNKENAVFLRLILNKRWISLINLKIDNRICSDLKTILPNFVKEEKDWELSTSEKIINILKL